MKVPSGFSEIWNKGADKKKKFKVPEGAEAAKFEKSGQVPSKDKQITIHIKG